MSAGERRRDASAFGELLATAAGNFGGKPASRTPGVKKVWFGDALRTFQPVRRRSYHAGDREHTIWRRIGDGSRREGRRFAGTMLSAARRFDREGRQPGRENGPLGHLGIEVLEALLGLVDFATGRLEPSIATIMERTRRSRGGVVEGMRRLWDAGFLRWIRRTVPVDDPDPFGPQVKQTSNAYWFDLALLPDAVRKWVKAVLDKGPAPEADGWAAEPASTVADMIGALPAGEQGSAWRPDDPVAGGILDRISTALAAREEADNASTPAGLNPGVSGFT